MLQLSKSNAFCRLPRLSGAKHAPATISLPLIRASLHLTLSEHGIAHVAVALSHSIYIPIEKSYATNLEHGVSSELTCNALRALVATLP
jgi:hypothetical protein